MTNLENSEATRIGCVRDPETHAIIGWLYEWEDGGTSIMWTGPVLEDYTICIDHNGGLE